MRLFHFDFVQSGRLEHGGRNLSSSESAYTWIESVIIVFHLY